MKTRSKVCRIWLRRHVWLGIFAGWLSLSAMAGEEARPGAAVERPRGAESNVTAGTSAHWAYQPIRSPDVPRTGSAWIRSPIDAFLLARLEREGLAPSAEADRETLLRRLYLDLLGLAPTLEEQAAFLNETQHDAYERLVDRLLESPHFGERWGRHWLDLARYADSNGYELDVPRPNAWRYRDWVVQAVNDDLPYDRFIVEQMAGDLLPDGVLSQAIATGFQRMTLKNDETGINEEDFRRREIVDRVNTTGAAILGLTLGCAECHDHKYDPVSLEEYYRFYAFFEHAAEVDRGIEGTPAEQAAFQQAASKHYDRWLTVQIQARLVEGLMKEGPAASRAVIEAAYQASRRQLESQRRLEELGLERWLEETPAEVRNALEPPSSISVLLTPDGNADKPHRLNSLNTYLASLDMMSGALEDRLASLGRYAGELGLPADMVAALLTPDDERTHDQRRRVAEYIAALGPQKEDLNDEIMQLIHDERYLPIPYVMVLEENPDDGRVTHVLLRGDFKQRGPAVEPGTPEFLPTARPRGARLDRLDLAHWLVDPANPLTRRVAVNHIWARLFGRGLVSTVDDFGIKGERPSHPELLDWLAAEFQRLGWSRKQLIRRIVLSSAYRQASIPRPELQARDPLNLLIARQARFRVEAEIVRDLFLSASGLLDRTLGGPTVYPPIPDSVRDLAYKYKLYWPTSAAPSKFRRGMYIHLRRSNPYPTLVMFDGPEGSSCLPFRNRSNTPLQALTTLNDPMFVENAQALGRRAVLEGPSDFDERVDWLFAACLGRKPVPYEKQVLQGLFHEERNAAAASPQEAAELLGAYWVSDETVAEAAAWAAMARVVLNLDEFLTRE